MFQSFDLWIVMLESLRSSISMVPFPKSICQKEGEPLTFWYILNIVLTPRTFQFRATILMKLDLDYFSFMICLLYYIGQIQLSSHHDFSAWLLRSSVLPFDNGKNWGIENEKSFGKNVEISLFCEEIFHFLKANVLLFMTSGEYRSVVWPIVNWSSKDSTTIVYQHNKRYWKIDAYQVLLHIE